MRMMTKLLLLLALVLPAAYAGAQQMTSVSGTIDSVLMDDGIIVIDGKRLAVRAADLAITYKGVAIRPAFLDTGMQVVYSTRADGSVSTITLIGPAAVLDALQDQ
jgi:hypothetical protein